MITELLNKAIDEVAKTYYIITEFQLGSEPMGILVEEFNTLVRGYSQTASILTTFRGIKITPHPSKDAIMYCLSFKSKKFAE